MDELLRQFNQRRKYKQISDSPVLLTILTGLVTGLNSMNSLSQGSAAKYSRSVLEDFLTIEGLPRKLRGYIRSVVKKMQRGKMINLENVKGKVVASVDGVETGRKRYSPEEFYKSVLAGLIDTHCQVASHLDPKTREVDYFEVYQRLVVICLITDRGPIPYSWAYQESEAGSRFLKWLESGKNSVDMPCTKAVSAQQVKQEGEITTLKKLIAGIKSDNPRGVPFDVLIGDGLYDKATIIDEVERYGISLIAVHKNERRTLHQSAEENFNTTTPDKRWSENDKSYEGWAKIYEDNNLKRRDKKVKIVRVIRHKKGESVDNYFYCSNRVFITPRFVEWCRFYRWKEENGFNAWTNQWQMLKHTFHNSHMVSDAMICLIFISIILVENYRKGNLNRGKHKRQESLKLFFRRLIKELNFASRSEFIRFHDHYINPSTVVT